MVHYLWLKLSVASIFKKASSTKFEQLHWWPELLRDWPRVALNVRYFVRHNFVWIVWVCLSLHSQFLVSHLQAAIDPDNDDDDLYAISVSVNKKMWMVHRGYEHLKVLDNQLHSCVYDRKFSKLPDLNQLIPDSVEVSVTELLVHWR